MQVTGYMLVEVFCLEVFWGIDISDALSLLMLFVNKEDRSHSASVRIDVRSKDLVSQYGLVSVVVHHVW